MINVVDKIIVDVLGTWYDACLVRPAKVREHDWIPRWVGVHVVPYGGARWPETTWQAFLVKHNRQETVLDGVLGWDNACGARSQYGHPLHLVGRLHTQLYRDFVGIHLCLFTVTTSCTKFLCQTRQLINLKFWLSILIDLFNTINKQYLIIIIIIIKNEIMIREMTMKPYDKTSMVMLHCLFSYIKKRSLILQSPCCFKKKKKFHQVYFINIFAQSQCSLYNFFSSYLSYVIVCCCFFFVSFRCFSIYFVII